jgi:hypothetical protein
MEESSMRDLSIRTEKKIIDVDEMAHVFYEMDTDMVMDEYFSFSCKGAKNKHRDMTKIRVRQSAAEMRELMDFFNDKDVDSYLELGLEEGGSFFLMSAYLASLRPGGLERATGLDKVNMCDYIKDNNEGKLDFAFMDCLDYQPTQNYDYIFIDTNQKYRPMKQTYLKYRPYCNKYIGFHDVKDRRYGAKQLFNELKEKHDHIYIDHSLAGIGVIIL